MMNFFNMVGDFFKLIWDSIVSILDALGTLLDIVTILPTLNSYMVILVPSVMAVSFSAFIAVGIVKLIVGR